MKIPLDAILEGCRAENRQMQAQLYKLQAPQLFAICLRYAKDHMEAEDILQNGFIKIFRQIHTFRAEGSFEGWMKRIMVYTAIESYRKNSRQLQLVDMSDVDIPAQISFDTSGLEVQDLMRMIQNLPQGYRMVFNLYAIEGYSHKEIAQQLSITEGASKSQLSRARSLLKKELEKMNHINQGNYAG